MFPWQYAKEFDGFFRTRNVTEFMAFHTVNSRDITIFMNESKKHYHIVPFQLQLLFLHLSYLLES